MVSNHPLGSFTFSYHSSKVTSSGKDVMDAALQTLHEKRNSWASVSTTKRIALLDQLIKDSSLLAHEWVNSCLQAKGYQTENFAQSSEWDTGPYVITRYLQRLKLALRDISKGKRPVIPGPVRTLPNEQVAVTIFPQTFYDKLLSTGITIETWMKKGVTVDGLAETQATPYFDKNRTGKVVLVLGAGNLSGIPATDVLSKLFVENHVVLLKLSPVNANIGPLVEKSFKALIELGCFRIVCGGAEEGDYLCNHSLVDEIHMTGSDKTFDAIVFGIGSNGAKRKEKHDPRLQKPITAELGNVTPLIVIPGPWSNDDIVYQAELIVSLVADNGGQTCTNPRVMILHASWNQKNQLINQLRKNFTQTPLRNAYYPGSHEHHQLFLKAHPEAELFGIPKGMQLPWTLMTGVDPQKTDDICFTTEGFFSYLAETEIEAPDIASYVDSAAKFANNALWGTLSAVILIHPASLKNAQVAASVERAINDLHYGTIALNYGTGTSWNMGVGPWGAFPESNIYNIQSGCGFVHNTFMFSQVQKTLLYAPFRIKPKPNWFITRKNPAKLSKRIFDFELSPSIWKVPAIVYQGITDR